jgi:hypothetical protein
VLALGLAACSEADDGAGVDGGSPVDGGAPDASAFDAGSAPDASILEDDAATRDASVPRRDAGPIGDTPLAMLAASMEPGTWAELVTEGLTEEITQAPPPGSGLQIMGWSDDAHWDSRTHQLLFMGLRQTRRFIAYSERTNAWRNIPFAGEPGAPHLENRFGHMYGNNGFDIERSRFYHLYHGGSTLPGSEPTSNEPGISYYDVVEERWVALPPGGIYPDTGCIEYFSARNGLVQDRGMFFSDDSGGWETFERPDVSGDHGLARHNPIREELLFVGGSDTQRVVVAMGAGGALVRWPDLPVDATVRFDKLTVDPLSGRYLLLLTAEGERALWELDGDTRTYRLVDDFTSTPFPFTRYDQPVVAFLPEHGVTMWVADRSERVWLYRHDR